MTLRNLIHMNVATPLKQEAIDSIFHSLPQEEQTAILSIGAAFRRLSLEKQLVWAKSKVQEFEARYHTTLDQLETDGLPDDANYVTHEDYIEWHYWCRVSEPDSYPFRDRGCTIDPQSHPGGKSEFDRLTGSRC